MAGNPDTDVVFVGRTDFRDAKRLFGIKRSDRRQHMYVIGKTGTGKSTLLGNLIVQDISNGEGLAVIDPHGELIEEILERIPEERLQDVVYFNPADMDSHIGFNVLELPDPKYKHLVASGLMGIFTKIWAGTWSARMEYILNNAVLALLDTPGTTLLGITKILVDKEYRQQIINNLKDPVVRAFWVNEYEAWQDRYRNEAIAPVQNKIGQFLSTALIRNVVGQSKSTIDIFEIMNSGKIFLVNLSKGRIGEDNSALLGAMLITKIQLSAMERVRIPEDERVDFYLYVDEFQNFATDSFAGILSEARKYRLNLIMAHQYTGQLVTEGSTKVRDAVFGNVGTMIAFRIGAADAEFLENEFEPEFTIQDMVNLPNRHVFLKIMCDGIASRPFSAATLPPLKATSISTSKERIIDNSRKKYARSRETVEEEINRWSGMGGMGSSGGGFGAGRPAYAGAGSSGPTGTSSGGYGYRPSGPRPSSRPSDFSSLVGMGIEFEEGKAPAPRPAPSSASAGPSGGISGIPPRPGFTRPSFQPRTDTRPPMSSSRTPIASTPRQPHLQEVTDVPTKQNVPGASLADLKPRESIVKKERPHSTVDVDEIRKAIDEALGMNKNANDEKPTSPGAA